MTGALRRKSELRFTKRTVDALAVGEKDSLFWDRDLAGFGVRVQPTGRKTYVVQSRGPSGPKRVTLGLHGDLSANEARKQAAVVIGRIKWGEDPVPVVPEPPCDAAPVGAHPPLRGHAPRAATEHSLGGPRGAVPGTASDALVGRGHWCFQSAQARTLSWPLVAV